MAGNDQADFAKRLKRIKKSNTRAVTAQFKKQGYDDYYEAKKTVKKKSGSTTLRWIIRIAAIYLFFAFAKSFIAFQMGAESYAARVAPLAEGEAAQKTIAAVMGLGPVEQAMIKGLGNASQKIASGTVQDTKKEGPETTEPSDTSN